MPIHRVDRRADVRGVLDQFEGWLLRERSAQERTVCAYTARVAGFVAWLLLRPPGRKRVCWRRYPPVS